MELGQVIGFIEARRDDGQEHAVLRSHRALAGASGVGEGVGVSAAEACHARIMSPAWIQRGCDGEVAWTFPIRTRRGVP
jgi:hypothetical protein